MVYIFIFKENGQTICYSTRIIAKLKSSFAV